MKIIAPRFYIILSLQVSQFDSGLQVKEKLLKKIESMQSPSRSFPHDIKLFRLVRSSTKELLHDSDLILNSNIKMDEEFVLTIKRTDVNMRRLLNFQTQHGPTEKEILNRTKNLPIVRSTVSASLNMTLDSTFLQGDLQQDLRKILSEIAKYSAFILGSLPYAEKLIRYYREKILYNLNNHQDIVRILMEMGFSQNNVIRALRLQGNNYTLALDWLIENGSNVNKLEEEEVTLNGEQGGGQSNINKSFLESSNNESNDIDNCIGDKKLYTKTFSSTNSIFYPKHKAIVSIDKDY
jgi:hypothetical protein